MNDSTSFDLAHHINRHSLDGPRFKAAGKLSADLISTIQSEIESHQFEVRKVPVPNFLFRKHSLSDLTTTCLIPTEHNNITIPIKITFNTNLFIRSIPTKVYPDTTLRKSTSNQNWHHKINCKSETFKLSTSSTKWNCKTKLASMKKI